MYTIQSYYSKILLSKIVSWNIRQRRRKKHSEKETTFDQYLIPTIQLHKKQRINYHMERFVYASSLMSVKMLIVWDLYSSIFFFLTMNVMLCEWTFFLLFFMAILLHWRKKNNDIIIYRNIFTSVWVQFWIIQIQ